MPHPEKARGPWLYVGRRDVLSWPVLLLGLVLGITAASTPGSAEAATLGDLRVGNHRDYIRIVFELTSPVQYQLEEDAGANKISIQFLETHMTIAASLETAPSSCLVGITTLQQDDRVVVLLRFDSRWNKLNPFTLREPDRIVLDVFCDRDTGADRSETEPQLAPTAQAPDTTPARSTEGPEPISTMASAPQVENETSSTVAKKPPGIEPATALTIATEPRIQVSEPKAQPAAPVAATETAPQKKDPFQKYLLILLAAITGIIVLLIALMVIQKKRQAPGSDAAGDRDLADPDETMRDIDQQIKAKLMKYDDQ